ncbi:MAG TPA: hypothetical protein VIN05_09135 [Roseovarius sp.]
MVSTSKILTVSYGTFSCTLEGFDDSFDTMKAIAEYFRDLSAGDRYFGAEPATPDAEMLARIAEREISRRVEARDADGTIHLRAGPATLAPMAQPVEESPAQDQTASAPVAPASPPAADTRPDDMSNDQPPAAAPTAAKGNGAAEPFIDHPAPQSAISGRHAQNNSESIADKLRRIRAVAGTANAAFSGTGYDDDEEAQDFLADPASDPAAEELADADVSADDDADNSAVIGADTAMAEVQDDEPALVAEAAADTHSEAEQEEALTSGASADAIGTPADEVAEAEADPHSEAEQEEAHTSGASADAIGTPADEVAEAEPAADLPGTAQPDSDAIALPTSDVAVTGELSDDDILSRLGSDVLHAGKAEETAASEDDAPAAIVEISDDYDADLYDKLNELLSGSLDGQVASTPIDYVYRDDRNDALAQLLADTVQSGPMSLEETDTAADIGTGETDRVSADAAWTILPDVVSDRSEDETDRPETSESRPLDAALTDQNLQEETVEADGDDSLSPEAEADLQRELAEVEAELSHSPIPEELIPHPADAPTPVAEDTDISETATSEDEDDGEVQDELPHQMFEPLRDAAETPRGHDGLDAQASRIFDEADTQLGEPESNKRRSAIQHLRAAVAATRAERRAGGAMSPGVDDQPYRKDLQSAVRPRRPQAVTPVTPRPSAAPSGRPAPLKLVAEQRIDTPADPVRPRRITRADLGAAPASSHAQPDRNAGHQDASIGFAGYAERMGANSLTDLLEAAAAYMADIEGTPQFSRPMLMQKLREAHEEDFSREEGLRSFGQLLRQGKLQRLKGGRFAVTDVTDFRQSA